MDSDELIRAAGVVLLRDSPSGLEVLLVHRPLHRDWSLPKGKVEPGEHLIDAAVRECDEETGYQVTLGPALPSISYTVLGQPKRVDYWVARARADEGFVPGDEIDEIRWLPVAHARGLLTYEHDADQVDRASLLPPTSPLIILRHTAAVKRADYSGRHDGERPLSGKGRSQAKALVPLLDAFGVEDVHSSDATRCHQSVRKLAKFLSTGIQHEPGLSEECFEANPERAAKRMRQLVRERAAMVVCSHRPVLPTLLQAAAAAFNLSGSGEAWEPKMPPGAFVVLHRSFPDGSDPVLVGIERHLPPGESSDT